VTLNFDSKNAVVTHKIFTLHIRRLYSALLRKMQGPTPQVYSVFSVKVLNISNKIDWV